MEYARNAMFGNPIQTYFSDGRKLNILDVGGGDGSRCQKEFYPGCKITTLDLKNGWDVMKFGLPFGEWDVIFSNHSIEHFSDPDFFLQECRKVMSNETILEIATPNLTAWFNRIFFLFGYVPHSVELSKKFNVGKPFNWNSEPLGGHIYIYTVDALKDLLKHHGFFITEVLGEHSTFSNNPIISGFDKIMTNLSPSLASAFRIRCVI